MAEIDGTWYGDGYFGYSVQGAGYPEEEDVRDATVYGPVDEYTGTLEPCDLAADIVIEEEKRHDIVIEEV